MVVSCLMRRKVRVREGQLVFASALLQRSLPCYGVISTVGKAGKTKGESRDHDWENKTMRGKGVGDAGRDQSPVESLSSLVSASPLHATLTVARRTPYSCTSSPASSNLSLSHPTSVPRSSRRCFLVARWTQKKINLPISPFQ